MDPTLRSQRERELLTKYGRDPEKYTISDDGRFVEKAPAPQPPAPIGSLETIGRSALGALPETMGGLVGGGLGAMGGTLASPLAGPLAPAVPFAGGLAGGLGGSYAGGKLEEKFAPQGWKDFTSKGAAENPLSAEIGAILPQIAASNPLKALRLTRDLVRATPTLTRYMPAQVGHLANIGVGGGLGAGSAIVDDVNSPEGAGAGTVAKAAIRGLGGGVLGSTPNALGRAMSLGSMGHSPEPIDNWAGARDAARKAAATKPLPADISTSSSLVRRPVTEITVEPYVPGQKSLGVQKLLSAPVEKDPMQAATDSAFAQRPPEVEPQYRREGLEGEMQGPQEPPVNAPNWVRPEQRKRLPEPAYEPPAQESLSDENIRSKRTQAKRAGYPQPERLQSEGQLGQTTDEWDNLIKGVADKVYKHDTETGGVVKGDNGAEIAGKINLPGDLERGLIQLSKRAGVDTGPHEILHGVIADVLARGTPGEKRFAQRVIDSAGGMEAFTNQGGKRVSGEEGLVQAGGQEFVRRLINETKGKDPSLFGDLTSFVRAKVGRATPRDLKALAANTLRRGAGAEQYRPDAPDAAPPVMEGENRSKKPSRNQELNEELPPDDVNSVPAARVGSSVDDSGSNPLRGGETREQPLGPREILGDEIDEALAPRKRINIFSGPLDRLEETGDPARAQTADMFRRLFSKADEMRGRYGADLLRELPKNPTAAREAYNAMIARDQTGQVPVLSPEAKPVYDMMSNVYRQMGVDQRTAGQLIGGRQRGIDPTGMFNIPAARVIETLVTANQQSPAWQRLRQEYIDTNTARGLTDEAAEEAFQRYVTGVANDQSQSDAVDFGAVSMRENTKLPDSWIEPDPAKAWSRYIDRFTKARAWHDVVDPRMQGVIEPLVKDPLVAEAFNSYRGTRKDLAPAASAVARVINSLLLGPITRGVDAATTPVKALGYVPPAEIPGMLGELRNIRKHLEDSYKTGFNSPGGDTVNREILGATEALSGGLQDASKLLSKYQGSEHLEAFARASAQAFGSYIGRIYRTRALAGDQEAARFLNKLGTDWQTVSPEELGTRVGRLFQGYYDARNQPAWLNNSSVSPFLTMSKWSVEQWNNFKRFGIEPATRGNPWPLAQMLAAGLGGGLTLVELRKLLNGKEPYIATIEEIKNAPDKHRATEEAVVKIGNALQAVSTLGIAGDLGMMAAKTYTDKFSGGLNNPAMEIVGDSAKRTLKAIQAVLSGAPLEAVLSQYAKDIANRNIQLMQLVTRGSESTERRNRVRDYRMWRRLSGSNDQLPAGTVDYSRADERQFDDETDPEKVKQQAADLVKRAREKFSPDSPEFSKEVNRLRAMRQTFMPEDETARTKYLEWLTQTQGKEKADKALEAYRRWREQRIEKRGAVSAAATK